MTHRAAGPIDRAAQLADDRRTPWLIGLWAAAEAAILPIVPDVGLALLVLARPARWAVLFAAVIAGAVAGSVALYALASADAAAVEAALLRVPGVDSLMLETVDRRLATDGVLAFAQLGPGPPLKVLTASWAASGGDPFLGVVGALINRLTRIGPVVVASWLVGRAAGPWLRRHGGIVVAAYVALWIAVYALFVL